ncbi:MAG: alpha/beta hydrolase [Burkholderiaceae bacterium]
MRSSRPDELTARLRTIGACWQQDIRAAGDATKALYRPLLAEAPRANVTVIRDQRYGSHPRQVLDVYRPAGACRAPVLAFVHGGAFVRGAKDIDALMYGNVLTWFARHGCVGVNIEYRLAPEARYPGGAADVGQACQWIHRHIAGHGGDPGRLGLLGHSAGGTHVATLACNPLEALPRHGACCIILVSARLKADVLPVNPNADGVKAYYGDDPAVHAAASPLTHAANLDLPAMIVNAEFENPLLDLYALEFSLALARSRARAAAPLHLSVPDHNHVSVMAHFNTSEQWLAGEILAFLQRAGR